MASSSYLVDVSGRDIEDSQHGHQPVRRALGALTTTHTTRGGQTELAAAVKASPGRVASAACVVHGGRCVWVRTLM